MAGKEWDVVFDDEFLAEFNACNEAVQDKILSRAGLLRQFGPNLRQIQMNERSVRW